MNARFPGRCACGARFPIGALIDYDRVAKKVTKCPACNGKVPDGRHSTGSPVADPTPLTDLGQPPSEPVSRYAPELPTPTEAEAYAAFEKLTSALDSHQAKIAAWAPGDGSTRVVAAAGSGKTRTTVALVARLLWDYYNARHISEKFAVSIPTSGGLNPGSIVVTTFTRKAAGELLERLARVVPPGSLDPLGNRADTLRVGTFHSLALNALRRRNASLFPSGHNLDASPRNAGIPSTALLWARILDYAGPEGLPNGQEGLGLADADSRAYALASDVARSVGSDERLIYDEIERIAKDRRLPYLPRAYRTFCECKATLGAWDFADALSEWHRQLGQESEKKTAEGGATPPSAWLVIVDEAQDNSRIQIEIARRLGKEIIFVGDLRQSIYGWRGAAPKLFEEADRTLGAKTLEIPTNYRSARAIVAIGNAVARGRSWSLGSEAVASRSEEGTITVAGYDTPSVESKAVAAEIGNAMAQGARADDHAILVRTNAAAAAFEASLLTAKIPVAVTGGTSFFGRRDILDALAYVSLSIGDDREALLRVANRPKRFLGKATMAQVRTDGDVVEALRELADRTRSRQASGLRDFADEIEAIREAIKRGSVPGAEEVKPGSFWRNAVTHAAKLLAPVDPDAGAADEDKGGLLPALVGIAKGFDSAQSLLAFAAKCRGDVIAVGNAEDAPTGRVIISTVHRAKGLEWPIVFVSASSGTFPHARAEKEGGERLEEEARLFYVATTRAKDTLHLSYSETDIFGRPSGPSSFLDLVPQTPGATWDELDDGSSPEVPPVPSDDDETTSELPLPAKKEG